MTVTRTMLAALVSAALILQVSAHYCESGSRVECTKVQSTAGAPSTFGESYDAHGYPLCTPAGEKVFCLVDHDYHKCAKGMAPCCFDGTNPHHEVDVGTSHGDNVTCKPAMGAPARLAPQGAQQVILDDADATDQQMANAFIGSFEPCMKDAYKGNFHHDWGKGKGTAHLSYHFDPPQDGCYLIEEYHPGSDETCARYLPSNAHMDLDYCLGQKRSFHINQGSKGAQWNAIGKFPFNKGRPGKLTMRNKDGEQCRSPPCFWVADAFRLTWMEDRCHSDGKLKMQVRLSDGNLKSDILSEMKEHKSVLESALEGYFGYAAVWLHDIFSTGRRLTDGDDTVGLHAQFMVYGTPTMTEAGDLGQVLQKALSSAGAGVEIESVETEWKKVPVGKSPLGTPSDPAGPTDGFDTESGSKALVAALIGGGSLALLLLMMVCGAVLWRLRNKSAARKDAQACTAEAVQDLEGATVKEDKVKQEDERGELESMSTATPPSDSMSDEGKQKISDETNSGNDISL